MSAVLQHKRLLLLERIAGSVDWPDVALHEDLRCGFRLVGDQKPCGIFDLEPRPSSLSQSELEECSKFVRPAILGKVKASSCDEDSVKLWEMTLEESTNNNWLVGPLTVDEVHSRHASWIPVRRFGVWQSSGSKVKLRPIDDYSENRVNSAFSYHDRISLRTLDQVVWSVSALVKMIRHRGEAYVKLSSGEELRGPLHKSFSGGSSCGPQLSVLDLTSAYKQLPLHPDSRKYSIIASKSPVDGSVGCFEGRVLPFGAVSSVINFNRVSRLIQRIGFELDLLWGNYYDDYPVLSLEVSSKSTMLCMISLLKLLGFDYADHKLHPFAARANVLGVELDLSRVDEGVILVRNKEGRVEEIAKFIREVLESRTLTYRACNRIVGRVQYADGQVMGRIGNMAMSAIRDTVKRHEGEFRIDDSLAGSFSLLVEHLPHQWKASRSFLRSGGSANACLHGWGQRRSVAHDWRSDHR